VLVLVPEVIGTLIATKTVTGGAGSSTAVPSTRVIGSTPQYASPPQATPAATDAPSVKFDHQKFDQGPFRPILERNVTEMWDRLWNDEDPNRTIVAQILHDVFFRWAHEGFKSRPMGILLYGPPGNGKTFLFDKYITKLGLELTNTNYAASRFQKGKVGEGEAAMVAEASKCKEDRTKLYLMFIDEIDSIGADRNKKSGESYKIDYCNTLLAIVGQPEYSNLIVVGATNYKENLDEALIRDGRLQNHYFLPSLDKDRRLALLCDKLGDTLVDLFQIQSVITPLQMSRIVKRKIQEDVAVLNYFTRNTINFTFAQFDRLRSEVDGVWRLFDKRNKDDENMARMFREMSEPGVTKEQILSNMSENLIMTAIDVYISHNLRVCLRDGVEKVLGSNQPNLRFNRMVLSRDNTTPAIDRFNREIKQFFEFHESYRSALASPTGRMILNVRDSSLSVELSNNTVITDALAPIHRNFNFPKTFFRANRLSRMLEPVISARNYGYVQIIDRETIDLDDEDRIFKLLKAKYEEAMALSKTDTASLLVINLSDIVGMITKIQQTARVSTKTENRQQKANVQELDDSKTQSRKVENVKNNSREQVLLNSFESSYKQSLLDTDDSLTSYENKLEFSNDLVKNSMEKESTAEKEQEFTSRTSRNRATRVSENESFLSKLLKKSRKENTNTTGSSRVESTTVEHVIGHEHDKTFREEITDVESQKKMGGSFIFFIQEFGCLYIEQPSIRRPTLNLA
ncbi:UNVERIFIED_CONTAM: i-AAA protease yme1, partial [Siphonaria sp. JEL0065]